MATGLHDTGEEYVIDTVLANETGGTSYSVGLFQETTGPGGGGITLTESDDIAAITNEPNDGNYARQSGTFSAADTGDWELGAGTLTFDVTSTTGTVNAYFVIVNFDSDDAGDGGTPADHLFFTGSMGQSRDLSQIDTLNVDNVGGSIT